MAEDMFVYWIELSVLNWSNWYGMWKLPVATTEPVPAVTHTWQWTILTIYVDDFHIKKPNSCRMFNCHLTVPAGSYNEQFAMQTMFHLLRWFTC